MLTPGPAKKITIHLNEDTSTSTGFLYREIFSFLLAQGVAGATMFRPVAEIDEHRHIHGQNGDGAQPERLPVRIEFIESVERFESLLPELSRLMIEGLIEVHDTKIVKVATGGVEQF